MASHCEQSGDNGRCSSYSIIGHLFIYLDIISYNIKYDVI